MAVPTVASGDIVASEDHNVLAGLFNGTTGYGEPVKLFELDDSASYSVTVGNQDTTNGLIQKWQYGPVGAPTVVMTLAKTGLSLPTLPLRIAGGTSPEFGGFSVTSTGEVLMGDIAATMVGSGRAQFAANYIQPANNSRVISLFDTTVRGGPSTDSSCSQFVLASGKVTGRDTSAYTPEAGGPGVTRDVDCRVIDGGWAGLVAAPNHNLRWGVSVGFESTTATTDNTGAYANEKVAFIALSDGDASQASQFVDSPTSNGTRPNTAFYAGGGGGASNPGGGTWASATVCAWEWPFYAAGTSNTAGIFCVYEDGRTGIAMVPKIPTRSGMLQINQDGNHDAGAGFRLWKNGSATNYSNIHHSAAESTVVTTTASGLSTNTLTLACDATLVACSMTAPASQSGHLLDLVISGSANTIFAVSAAGDLLVGNANTQVGSGAGVIAVKNAATLPSTNPSGGGVLYADAGAGKWRGSGGTTTTFGAAEPHCPTCDRDFALEWESARYGMLAICMYCLTDAIGDKGVMWKRPGLHKGERTP